MKHIFVTAVFLLSSLLAPQAAAASAVSATLTLPHDNVLPGVPFDLVVTFTNVSDRPITVDAARATLVVTFANGETVVMHKPEVSDQWTIRGSMPVPLGPGESVQQAASWENGSVPNWFYVHGASFAGPGTYGIALDLRIVDEDRQLLGTVRTAAVTLTRIAPVGIDAELWKRMQEMSGGRWSDHSFDTTKTGNALGSEIIQLHPSCGYYPYVVALRAFRSKDKHHIPVLLEAAERFPSSPAYPYLLKAAAECALYEAWKARDERDVVAAQKYFTLAETKFREALATQSVGIRASAQEGLRHVAHGRDRLMKKQVP
jgi:hypothetical protein